MISEMEICIRLFGALILGAIVGSERQWRRKSAGLRTHVLVSIGSCLIMTLSIDIYYSVQGLTNADPTRLAAQVVSGIGFLGAGTIMKEGLTVVGLTTAASLWVVAAIGLAVGSGHYFAAVATTVLSYLTLTLLVKLEKFYSSDYDASLTITAVDQPGQIGRIGSYLGSRGINIRDIKILENQDGILLISLNIRVDNNESSTDLISEMMNIEGILGATREWK